MKILLASILWLENLKLNFKNIKMVKTINFKNRNFQIHENDLISSIIEETNEFYEIDIFNNFKNFIPKNGIFLDIGANIGNHSIMFSSCFNNVEVFSFEPFSLNYELLLHNTRFYPKIHPLKLALGSNEGIIHISNNNDTNKGGAFVSNKGEKCPVMALDSLNIKDISFIKIDIEGHEFSAIEGATKTIINFRPVIWIEDFTGETINYLVNNLNYKIQIKGAYKNYLLTP